MSNEKTEPPQKAAKISFADTKNGVTVECTRNVPLAMIVRGDPALMADRKVRKGGRVERGTKITVPKEVADRLKAADYAK